MYESKEVAAQVTGESDGPPRAVLIAAADLGERPAVNTATRVRLARKRADRLNPETNQERPPLQVA